MKSKFAVAAAAVVSAFIGLTPLLASAGEVNVYSYRKPKLIDPMFEVFTEQTGIKVNSVFTGHYASLTVGGLGALVLLTRIIMPFMGWSL